jgi:pimeloyl-ACP methyl ester carboxylesterase
MTESFPERGLRFGRAGNLVGVLTRPSHEVGTRVPTVVFLNSGIIHRVGANRLYVRLARALAREGIPSLRFDLSGVGDSGPHRDEPGLSLTEIIQRDIQDAFAWLVAEGAEQFVPIGLCSGADNAFYALTRDERVPGAVLLDPFVFRTWGFYLRYYGPRVLRPDVWWRIATGRSARVRKLVHGMRRRFAGSASSAAAAQSPAGSRPTREVMRAQWRSLVSRDARVLMLFTAGLQERCNYREQFFDAFPGLDFGECVQVEYFADADHTFSRECMQVRLEQVLLSWYRTRLVEALRRQPGAAAASMRATGS